MKCKSLKRGVLLLQSQAMTTTTQRMLLNNSKKKIIQPTNENKKEKVFSTLGKNMVHNHGIFHTLDPSFDWHVECTCIK